MYNDFYGLDKSPFNIAPDPQFLFLSNKHREALNHLLFGIAQRKGFIQLTGEVGAGKTTICRQLLSQLDLNVKTALILNPCMTPLQMLRTITQEFDITPAKQDRVAYIDAINIFLLDQARFGQEAVLIIDEAQDMTFEMLEQVRLLSNLETDQSKLMQIVLMGQPELRDKLNDPRMKQLRQRITVRYHLETLTRDEMTQYIHSRLRIAGSQGEPSFSHWALRRIHRYSAGVPRLVNSLCDMTLLAGYAAGQNHITHKLVGRGIAELEGKAA